MNIYQNSVERVWKRGGVADETDAINSGNEVGRVYDNCLVCCFIYCCLPFIELSENNHDIHEYREYNEYPENFFHIIRT